MTHLQPGTCQQGPAPGCPLGKRRSRRAPPDGHSWGCVVIAMQVLVALLPLRSVFHAERADRAWARVLHVRRVVLERYSLLQHRDFCAAAPLCQQQ